MKTSILFASLAIFAVAAAPINAAPPETASLDHSHQHAADQGAQADSVMARAQKAKTPAERNKLMAENMAMMKAHMSEMNGMIDMGNMMGSKMMEGKPMPMAMDAAHMEKMHKHMTMMHEMMERLIVQQDLMMRPMK